MNKISIFCLIVLIILRAINTVVLRDFYKKTNDSKYLLLGMGWFLWEISALLALLMLNTQNQFYIDLIAFHSLFLSNLAIVVLSWGFISFITEISKRFIVYNILTIILINYIIFFIFEFSLTIEFSSLMESIIWISFISYFLIKGNEIIKIFKVKRWYVFSIVAIFYAYLPIRIFIYMKGFSGALFFIDNIFVIMVNYGYILLITLFLTYITIYLKKILPTTQKNQLKEKYSLDKVKTLQNIITDIELLEKRIQNGQESPELQKLLEKKRKEASDLLKKIKDL
jgi:hypothetical protein